MLASASAAARTVFPRPIVCSRGLPTGGRGRTNAGTSLRYEVFQRFRCWAIEGLARAASVQKSANFRPSLALTPEEVITSSGRTRATRRKPADDPACCWWRGLPPIMPRILSAVLRRINGLWSIRWMPEHCR